MCYKVYLICALFGYSFFCFSGILSAYAHHLQNMVCILVKCFPLGFEFICQFKKQCFVVIIPFEERNKNGIPLRKVGGDFACITVMCCRLFAIFLVNKGGNGFVYGNVLLGQIIIIFVVGIKIFQFFFIKRNSQFPVFLMTAEITVIDAV